MAARTSSWCAAISTRSSPSTFPPALVSPCRRRASTMQPRRNASRASSPLAAITISPRARVSLGRRVAASWSRPGASAGQAAPRWRRSKPFAPTRPCVRCGHRRSRPMMARSRPPARPSISTGSTTGSAGSSKTAWWIAMAMRDETAATRQEAVDIAVDDEHIEGTVVAPQTSSPGVLFVHGWGGNQQQYLARARTIAALGCVCIAFDLRGHGGTEEQQETVTREENLNDVIAAYDALAGQPGVDPASIVVVGSSYGGYLAAILTSLRPVRWLALRVPALYKDEDWALPKVELKKYGLAAFRRGPVKPRENRALAACAAYEGDVLIVESEHDDIIPHPVIANYMAAFQKSHSVTYRVIQGADHGLSDERPQEAYTSLLVNWATEMVIGARQGGTAPDAHTHLTPSPPRGPPRPS